MDETAPGFYGHSQEGLSENAPPTGVADVDAEGVGMELGGANLVAQPHKVCSLSFMVSIVHWALSEGGEGGTSSSLPI